jgi:peptidoglycan/xylan/chitin deacetylase (PgdA/CDA1 family)
LARAVRLDRFLTLRLIAPLQRLSLISGRRTVLPILMYHGISNEVDTQRSGYYRTVTTPATFERHMAWLGRHGYRGMTLSAALEAVERPAAGARPRPVAITFDDGLLDFATTAHPILQRAAFGATVFLSTAYIGRRFPTGQTCMSADQIKALSAVGVEFGSHTVTHPQLISLRADEVEYELTTSKHEIERIIGREVSTFSYPYQFPEQNHAFVAALRCSMQKAGYRAGVTTVVGRAGLNSGTSTLLLKRLPINECDDELLFAAKLQGSYDWVRAGQYAYKILRASARRRAAQAPASAKGHS